MALVPSVRKPTTMNNLTVNTSAIIPSPCGNLSQVNVNLLNPEPCGEYRVEWSDDEMTLRCEQTLLTEREILGEMCRAIVESSNEEAFELFDTVLMETMSPVLPNPVTFALCRIG